jgi:hypothetical protein
MTNTNPQLQKELDAHGWIGVDLDGTLAQYTESAPWNVLGQPVPAMLARVKAWLAEDKDVRVLTARVFPYIPGISSTEVFSKNRRCFHTGEMFSPAEMVLVIQKYTFLHLGKILPVTCAKDSHMIEQWDDRTVQVVPNTGQTLAEHLAEQNRKVSANHTSRYSNDYIVPASASHGPR